MKTDIKLTKVKPKREITIPTIFDEDTNIPHKIIPIFPSLLKQLGQVNYCKFELYFCKSIYNFYIEEGKHTVFLKNHTDDYYFLTCMNILKTRKIKLAFPLSTEMSEEGKLICKNQSTIKKRIHFLSMVTIDTTDN